MLDGGNGNQGAEDGVFNIADFHGRRLRHSVISPAVQPGELPVIDIRAARVGKRLEKADKIRLREKVLFDLEKMWNVVHDADVSVNIGVVANWIKETVVRSDDSNDENLRKRFAVMAQYFYVIREKCRLLAGDNFEARDYAQDVIDLCKKYQEQIDEKLK